MTKKENALKAFLEESLSYRNFKDLESLIQDAKNLEHLPIWPLYFTLREGTSDQLIEALPLLTKKQRQTLRDLETWDRDQMDVREFDRWCVYIFKTQNLKVIEDFVIAKDFLVYLKGRFTISVFDQEDPEYPENDNFFITDDNQFLFEFEEGFEIAEEVKSLVKHFYAHYGVELARDILISLIPDSYLGLQEETYIWKRERLREIGHIDYYEALELKSIFTYKSLRTFITKRIDTKYIVPEQEENQNLGHYNKVVLPFHNQMGSIFEELERIENTEKHQFLLYNFSCLINAQLILNDLFRNEQADFTELGERCRQRVNLGLSYVQSLHPDGFIKVSVLEFFNFYDLYKIGNSLLMNTRKDLKKDLEVFGQKVNVQFLGDHWSVFLEDVFENNFKLKKNNKAHIIETNDLYQELLIRKNILVNSLPVITQFFKTVESIKQNAEKTELLNMDIEELDFESLLITQFIRFTLGLNEEGYSIPIQSFWDFLSKNYFTDKVDGLTEAFFKKYGLDTINNFELWFKDILAENFNYLRSEDLSSVEVKFISGVLLKG